MWQDGQDTNEDGVPVRLYQPILYSKRAASADAKSSHVGGVPAYFDSDTVVNKETPQCSGCQQEMYLLLQLYNPDTERTLYVFGCNRGSCVASAFENSEASISSQFSLGGSGRFVCRHSQPSAELSDGVKDATPPAAAAAAAATPTPTPTAAAAAAAAAAATAESPWGADNNDNADADNDWDMDEDDDNVDDVEAMVAAMEIKRPVMKAETSKPSHTPISTSKQSQASSSSFPCFEIHSLQEPASRRSDDMDDDDVGMMGMSTDDKKIQEMLARYMQEEEDEDILAAIQGARGSGGRAGEKDERLPAEDRAMLAFTDRVKRSPRQIVRYARGGIPFWSVPLPTEPQKTTEHSGRAAGQSHSNNKSEQVSTFLPVPNCSCGAQRQFECQLMPNLLGVLDVDKHARAKEHKPMSNLNINELMGREFGGMNWGALAIYTCKDDCDSSREDYVVVQDSIDGTPEKRSGATDDAMVVDADKQQDVEDEDEEECSEEE